LLTHGDGSRHRANLSRSHRTVEGTSLHLTGNQQRSNRRFNLQGIRSVFGTAELAGATIPFRLIDISIGGAAISVFESIPSHVVHCMLNFQTGDLHASVGARILGCSPNFGSRSLARLEFLNPPTTLFAELSRVFLSEGRYSLEDMEAEGFVRRPEHLGPRRQVQWDRYAEAYDIMCAANPAYQENIDLFTSWMSVVSLPRYPIVCDIGAGTGNYIAVTNSLVENARFIHIDRDPVMSRYANRKYRQSCLSNVTFHTDTLESVAMQRESVDLIICVNALYTFSDPFLAIHRMFDWLSPGGYLFSIDLGRPMDVLSWSRYILVNHIRSHGLLDTAKQFYRGRAAVSQNRVIRAQQDAGAFWLHSTESFEKAFVDAGFHSMSAGRCYRGYCDFIVATKPP